MRTITITVIMLMAISATAQFSAGDKFIGGSVYLSSQTVQNADRKTSQVSIAPAAGFLVSENLAIGGRLGYSHSRQDVQYSPDLRTVRYIGYSAGVFVTRYMSISDNFLFTFSGDVAYTRFLNDGYQFDPFNGEVVESKTKSYSLDLSVKPRFVFFPDPRWGIEAGLGSVGYSLLYGLTYDYKINSFTFNYSGVSLGVTYYFRNTSGS